MAEPNKDKDINSLYRCLKPSSVLLSLPLMQFACDTTGLAECVAEKLNISAALVTPCLIRSLNVSVEGGLEICPSQGPSCPFPEVSRLLEPLQNESVAFAFAFS